MKRMIKYIRARIHERSTWAGLGAAISAALLSVGQYLTQEETRFFALVVVIAGALAAILPSARGERDA